MSKKKKMDAKRTFFTVIVVLIVLAFVASFFSMIAFSGKRDDNEEEKQQQELENESNDVQAEEQTESMFMQSVKDSMIVGNSDKETAQSIATTLNVYNSLNSESKLISFDGNSDDYSKLKNELIDSEIYFDDISSSDEESAWKLIEIDEDGVAYLK